MATTERTTLNRSWLKWKILLWVILAAGFGVYCLYDGLVAFPAHGQLDADYKLRVYLDLARQVRGRLGTSSIPDPEKKRSDLAAQRDTLVKNAGSSANDYAVDLACLNWLDSLAAIGHLRPEYTTFANPDQRLAELSKAWEKKDPPKPLAAYDIPLQLMMAAGCFAAVGWGLFIAVRAARRVYQWDPATKTLTFPDGRSIAPADVADFDKRKWDKFYIFLHLKDGSVRKLDLYPHTHLEQWVLEMERTAFPDRGEEATPHEPHPIHSPHAEPSSEPPADGPAA